LVELKHYFPNLLKPDFVGLFPLTPFVLIFYSVSFLQIIPHCLFASTVPFDGHFCSSGKGVYGFLTGCQGYTSFEKKSSSRRAYLFFKNLDNPKPYTDYCPETIDDRRDNDALD
jgi:hypothetical protein